MKPPRNEEVKNLSKLTSFVQYSGYEWFTVGSLHPMYKAPCFFVQVSLSIITLQTLSLPFDVGVDNRLYGPINTCSLED